MTEPIIQLTNVAMRYDTADGPVLADINLTIERGESIAIVGESGCGKSTLLNLIGALDRPTARARPHSARAADGGTAPARAARRGRRRGFISQDPLRLRQGGVLGTGLFPPLVPGPPGGADGGPRQLLGRVGLSDKLDARPGQLSGGQRQRVAVVRAVINEPVVLLADEPTGSLDRASSDNLADLLAELNGDDGLTLVVVTHAMPLAQRMSRVLRLTDGTLTDTTAT